MIRGLAAWLMYLDHLGYAVWDRRVTESRMLHPPPPNPSEVFFRIASTIAAVTYPFMCGFCLARSIKQREKDSGLNKNIYILKRAIKIILVELLFINTMWHPDELLLQIMYAIGLSMICMIGLRELSNLSLLIFSASALIVSEYISSGEFNVSLQPMPILTALTLTGGMITDPDMRLGVNRYLCAYPFWGWCAIMVMGFVLSRKHIEDREMNSGKISKDLLKFMQRCGTFFLAAFVVIRWMDKFGNQGIFLNPRDNVKDALAEFFFLSRYPHSIAYVLFIMGVLFWVMARIFRKCDTKTKRPNAAIFHQVSRVFGQVPLRFYMLHILLLEWGAKLYGVHHMGRLRDALALSVIILPLLFALCQVRFKYFPEILLLGCAAKLLLEWCAKPAGIHDTGYLMHS